MGGQCREALTTVYVMSQYRNIYVATPARKMNFAVLKKPGVCLWRSLMKSL